MAKTFIDGEQLTALKINTHLNHELISWQSYAPDWNASAVNPIRGNGSIAGRWCSIGKTIHFTIVLTFGSSTNIGSGPYTFGLPVPAANYIQIPVGSANLRDNSTTTRAMRTVYLNTPTTIALANESGALVTHASPWTWAAADTILISGTYEAA